MRRRGASLHTARGLQMLGAIAGDIIGSVHEFTNTRTKGFELFAPNCFFTDDTVLTAALATRDKPVSAVFDHASDGVQIYWAP